MSLEAAIDNDVLIKSACFDLLDPLAEASGNPHLLGILGVAKYVVTHHLSVRADLSDGAGALARFETFMRAVSLLEPNEEEINLATAIEELAVRAGLPLDTGESQLCAIVIHKGAKLLITADKKAIESLEILLPDFNDLDHLQERVASFEQLVIGLTERLGPSETRQKVCAESGCDKTMSICFQCASNETQENFQPVGLASYINDLRDKAPTLLAPGEGVFGL